MICAKFYKDGERLRATVSGHAEYCEIGGDIVCSAISGMVYSIIGYMINLRNEQIEIYSMESGLVDFSISSECEELLALICMGFIQIEMTYHPFVSVENLIWNWTLPKTA